MAHENRKYLIYVAGPYRDARGEWFVNRNVASATAQARRLMEEGFSVICPHKNTQGFGGVIADEGILDHCFTLISRCDAVVLTRFFDSEDIKKSTGTQAEIACAYRLGIPVLEGDVYVDEIVDAIREAKEAVAKRVYAGGD